MLQEAVDELENWQGAEFCFTCSRGCVTKGNLIIGQLHNPVIAQSDPKNVGGQILEGGTTIANWLTMNDPILLPYRRGYLVKEVCLLQNITKLGPKDRGKRLDGYEKRIIC